MYYNRIVQITGASRTQLFKAGERAASEGHILDRVIGLAKTFNLKGSLKKYINLASAFKDFLKESHQPAGLKEFLYEMSRQIIFVVNIVYLIT